MTSRSTLWANFLGKIRGSIIVAAPIFKYKKYNLNLNEDPLYFSVLYRLISLSRVVGFISPSPTKDGKFRFIKYLQQLMTPTVLCCHVLKGGWKSSAQDCQNVVFLLFIVEGIHSYLWLFSELENINYSLSYHIFKIGKTYNCIAHANLDSEFPKTCNFRQGL